jgi:hypothetical protein
MSMKAAAVMLIEEMTAEKCSESRYQKWEINEVINVKAWKQLYLKESAKEAQMKDEANLESINIKWRS